MKYQKLALIGDKYEKLFNATFEQSLNLEDDKLIKYMQKDVERPDVKEKPILLKVLAVVMIMLLYGIAVLADFSTNILIRIVFYKKEVSIFTNIFILVIFRGICISLDIYSTEKI